MPGFNLNPDLFRPQNGGDGSRFSDFGSSFGGFPDFFRQIQQQGQPQQGFGGLPLVPQANSPGVPSDPSNLLEIFGASGFGQTGGTLGNTLLTLSLLSGGGFGGGQAQPFASLFSGISP
jgi:hypothetical protein